MKKHGVNKFIGLLLPLSLITSMLFSFVSFAEAYTGAYLYTGVDPVTGLPITEVRGVNPTGQTFSGENKIEMNAFNNAPILTDNTFNGSTDITTAYTDITSNGNTYNGTTTLDYSSVTGGSLQSSGDSFRTTNVEASDADVSISNGTFNGALSINANSVSLGSITQMDSLLSKIDTTNTYLTYLINIHYVILDNMTRVVNSSSSGGMTINVTTPIGTTSYQLSQLNATTYQYDSSTHEVTSSNRTYRVNFIGSIFNRLSSIVSWCSAYSQWWSYWFESFFDYIKGNGSYRMYTFSYSGETYSFSSSNQTVDFRDVIANRLDMIMHLLNYFCTRFFQWYYPLDNTLPEYWRVYNTDTQEQEDIGLAGLMYNISWYLGQLYALQVESGPLTQLSEDVDAAADSMASMEAQEESVISSISSGIDSFVPDLSELGAFTALAWCSNYLQQCWVSLGMYGTVIMIGLLLAVCMQFIGYFRYK